MRHSLSGQIINWAGWTLRVNPNPLNIVKSCPCEFWFDGQDASTIALNVNRVIQWDDKSGNARHVSNAVDAQRPTYSAATGRVTFAVANSTYLQSAAFGPLTQPNTIYVLVNYINNAGDPVIFDALIAIHVFYSPTGAGTFQIHTGAALADGAFNANDNIHTGEFNGAASNYWINGVNVAAGNAGGNALDGITLGTARGLVGNWSSAEIMEVFGYNCSITEAERIKCDNYLINKWGLPY